MRALSTLITSYQLHVCDCFTTLTSVISLIKCHFILYGTYYSVRFLQEKYGETASDIFQVAKLSLHLLPL
jgi:hypothetical protein